MKVALVQMDVAFGNPEANVKNVARLFVEAAAAKPDGRYPPCLCLLPATR